MVFFNIDWWMGYSFGVIVGLILPYLTKKITDLFLDKLEKK